MVERFRQLEEVVRAARGEYPPFVINLEDNRVNVVGTRGRPTRSCRRDYAPQPRGEESDGSGDRDEEESDAEESDLDTPLT